MNGTIERRTDAIVKYSSERFGTIELRGITEDLDREWREAIDFDHATPAGEVHPGTLTTLPTTEPSTVYKGSRIPDGLEVRLNPTSGWEIIRKGKDAIEVFTLSSRQGNPFVMYENKNAGRIKEEHLNHPQAKAKFQGLVNSVKAPK